jgi:hypothetical protein
MKVQVLKRDALYHGGDPYVEGTIRHLLKSGVDRSRIINFIHLRTGCLLSGLQLALMGSPDLRRALEESDGSS